MASVVESPCIKVCVIDQWDMCLGCGRYLSEISQWGMATEKEKERILKESILRLDKL